MIYTLRVAIATVFALLVLLSPYLLIVGWFL